jgi:hypothetical protein
MKRYFPYLILLLVACNRVVEKQNGLSDISSISHTDSTQPVLKPELHNEDSLPGRRPVYLLPAQDGPGAVPFYYTRPFINNE